MLKQIEKLIGTKVIIRSYAAGVFYGKLAEVEPLEDKYAVTMRECRRLWYWSGACSLSQLATDGVANPNSCKFTVYVPEMCSTGVIEVISPTSASHNSIESVKIWRS